jgi:hypothetical protein
MNGDEQRTPGGLGLYRDLHNLQQNGAASLEELKEFLNSLQGRSPQEVVGIVSSSMLVQSMVLATLATFGILVVFTVGPYLVYGPPQQKKPATAAAPAAAAPSEAPASAAATPAAETAQTGELSDEDKSKALSKLGIDETKTADPNTNPLEKNLDNLLDNVK